MMRALLRISRFCKVKKIRWLAPRVLDRQTRPIASRLASLISDSGRSWSIAWKMSIMRTIELARVPVYTAGAAA